MSTPRIAIISANMGNFDPVVEPVAQSVQVDYYRFTDENFPRRFCAMTPRMQARIPKCFGWQMVPGYDYYLWIDSSLSIINSETVVWFLDKCKDVDAVFFRHPDRNNIREEADFIEKKIQSGNRYLSPRYTNESSREELSEIFSDPGFEDNLLIASGAFIYKLNDKTIAMMKEWWYHISRYHIVDQLGLPYAIYKAGCSINIIEEHYMYNPYIAYTRNKK